MNRSASPGLNSSVILEACGHDADSADSACTSSCSSPPKKRSRICCRRRHGCASHADFDDEEGAEMLAKLPAATLRALAVLPPQRLQQLLLLELADRSDDEDLEGGLRISTKRRREITDGCCGCNASSSFHGQRDEPLPLPWEGCWTLVLPFVLEPCHTLGLVAAVARGFCSLAFASETWAGLQVNLAVNAHPPAAELARRAVSWSRAAVVCLDLCGCPSPHAAAAVADAMALAAPGVRVELLAPRGFHRHAAGRLVELWHCATVAAVRGHDSRTPACLSAASYCCGAVVIADAPLQEVAAGGGGRSIEFEAVRTCQEHRCQRGVRVGITATYPRQLQDQLVGGRGLRDSIHEVRQCLFISVAGDVYWRDERGGSHFLGRHIAWSRSWQVGDRLRLALVGRHFEIAVNGAVTVRTNLPQSLVPEALLLTAWWAVLDLSRGFHSVALLR